MNRRRFIAAGAATLAATTLSGCTEDIDANEEGGNANDGGDTSPTDSPTPTEAEYADAWYYHEDTGIALRDVEGTVGDYSTEISGEATNESDTDYDYAQLEFALYDDTDAKVGDALANTSGLPAGQRWKFEAIGTETDNVSSFELTDVTAY